MSKRLIRRALAVLRARRQPKRGQGLLFVYVHPVQQVAAEPATLALLRRILDDSVPTAPEALLATSQLTGWPLVNDPDVPAGEVHCRPAPGAPPPPTAAELDEWMRALTTVNQIKEKP